MLDHKTIMKAILSLIEKHLRHETISPAEFSKVEDQMVMYYEEYDKKHPGAKSFDSPLAAWLIHDQMYLAGTQHASGGPPYYFWDLIQDECAGGERQFKHCT